MAYTQETDTYFEVYRDGTWTTKVNWYRCTIGRYPNPMAAWDALSEWFSESRDSVYRIRRGDVSLWQGYRSDWKALEGRIPSQVQHYMYDETTTTQETNMIPDLEKPLSIPRETLIATLQANVDKLAQERADADARNVAAHQEMIDAIATLSDDEVYNIVVRYYTSEPQIVRDDHEAKVFVSQEVKQTQKESDTEKMIRVLKLASDETIEITPNQELYGLL